LKKTMSEILTHLSHSALATAAKDNLYAFFRCVGGSSRAEFSEAGGLARWHTQVPHPWFNGVLSTRPPVNGERAVQDALGYFDSRDVASFTWWLAPRLPAAAWEPHLHRRGFRYDNSTPGMAADLGKLKPGSAAPAGLSIRPVEDLPTLQEWARTFITGYELPGSLATVLFDLMAGLGLDLPLRHYLGYLDGVPVTASTLFLGAGVAGIYNVATVPEARGHGLGSLLTLSPLQEAQTLGYRAGVLQSSEMGFPVYRRLGFEKVCIIDHFYWSSGMDPS
jgi:ribosomal protein S18 acetylase RimI-like enzyme